MAKVIKNMIVAGLSGRLGKRLVARQMKDGRTIVATMPDFSNRVFSEEQVAHQSRFKQASAYARNAARTEPIYARLAAGTTKTAYATALADWFHPPTIHDVTRLPGRIRVHATDDVLVTQVLISITDELGNTLDPAEAVQTESGWWQYNTSSAGAVTVQARDLAGNLTNISLPAE